MCVRGDRIGKHARGGGRSFPPLSGGPIGQYLVSINSCGDVTAAAREEIIAARGGGGYRQPMQQWMTLMMVKWRQCCIYNNTPRGEVRSTVLQSQWLDVR